MSFYAFLLHILQSLHLQTQLFLPSLLLNFHSHSRTHSLDTSLPSSGAHSISMLHYNTHHNNSNYSSAYQLANQTTHSLNTGIYLIFLCITSNFHNTSYIGDHNRETSIVKPLELIVKCEKNNTCYQFSSAAQLCLTFCDPMDCSTPGFPVPYCLPKFAQTHVH